MSTRRNQIIIGAGTQVGRWTVIEEVAPLRTTSGRTRRWRCRCACGREKLVLQQSLSLALRKRSGGSRSCGCLAIERATIHGNLCNGRPSPEYMAWQAAKKRCGNPRNPSFPTYGGRGITMCGRWLSSFDAFLSDLGPKPGPEWSLDRIDPDIGYDPGNCRWAKPLVQSRNRRTTRWYEFEGQVSTIGEVARFLGLTRDQARSLERRGILPARRSNAKPSASFKMDAPLVLDLNRIAPLSPCEQVSGTRHA